MGMLRNLLGRLAFRFVRLSRRFEEERILQSCSSNRLRMKIRMPVTIYNPEKMVVGDQVHVGEYVHIRARGGLHIGSRVAIAAHTVITTQGHPVDLPRFNGKLPITTEAPIVIQDDVWIGSGAIILPGVTIGRGSVIAAGAVVSHDVPEFAVVAGIPGRVIRSVAV
jgi:acetyltransferase-like isoleucine patch superfamily enzyme